MFKLSISSGVIILLCMLLLPMRGGAQTLLVMGDSLSAAYGIPVDQGWVALLQKQINKAGIDARVVNASITGETTGGGLARFDQVLQQNKPELVILELGANDGLRGFSIKRMRTNLGWMVKKSHDMGAKVLLLGMRIPPNYGKRYTEQFYQVYAEIADQYKLVRVPFFLEGVGGNGKLMQRDGLHPNAKAQPIIVETVWAELQTLLLYNEAINNN